LAQAQIVRNAQQQGPARLALLEAVDHAPLLATVRPPLHEQSRGGGGGGWFGGGGGERDGERGGGGAQGALTFRAVEATLERLEQARLTPTPTLT